MKDRSRSTGMDAVRESDRVRPIIGVQLQTTALFEYLSSAELIELFAGLYESDASPANVSGSWAWSISRKRRSRRSTRSPAGSGSASSIALALVNDPRSSFSTSRRPVLTRARGAICGR